MHRRRPHRWMPRPLPLLMSVEKDTAAFSCWPIEVILLPASTPLRTSSIALHHVAGALFGPGNLVMRCRENMYAVCPYLATSWTTNPGFTEWTFTIRGDVRWHDGTPFTAEDARFWLELAQFGATVGDKVRAPAYFKGELGDVERVEVLEHDRLRVTFGHRNPHFLEVLANPRFKIAHPRPPDAAADRAGGYERQSPLILTSLGWVRSRWTATHEEA